MRVIFGLLLALPVLLPPVMSAAAGAGPAVAVSLPDCDFIIDSASDWGRLNDPDLRVFCVAPGRYGYNDVGVITLSRSGTQQQPRFLRWYDPQRPDDTDTHVVDIPEDRQAVIPQFRLMADYWVIDRIVLRGGRRQNTLERGASHNVLNRILIEGGSATLFLQFVNSSDNILQHSVLRNTVAIPGRDSYAIYFADSEGERIVDNEIYNFGGGIQQAPMSRNNHLVYGNEMYITDELYTDCRGNRDPNGACMCSEGMALALKGVNRPGTTFRFEHNIVYGMRPHDDFCMGSGTPGAAIDLGSGATDTRNVIISNNILLNRVPNNINMGLHVGDVQVTGNVIGLADHGITNVYGKNVSVVGNLFIDNGKDYHTGRRALQTTYENNRRVTAEEEGEICFRTGKFTGPGIVCLHDFR